MGSTTSPQARVQFQQAFNRFEKTISFDDKRDFLSTTLKDVREAARAIEKELGNKGSLRNMRRLQPFFEGLERYSKIVEVLCNGTPYLSFVWAPIKLMLTLASDYLSAFDKLIGAYARIAENLPRFDKLSATFRGSPDFQQVLAMVYSDILEFHRRAYQFFRRRGWSCFFDCSWARFTRKFSGILEDLATHTDLVDKEANALHISQSAEMRARASKEIAESESYRISTQMQAVKAWLETNAVLLHDELDRVAGHHFPGSTDWITKSSKMKTWVDDTAGQSILWLVGKPGAGKSVVCSKVIQDLQRDQQRATVFYLCNHFNYSNNESSSLLRSIVSQMVHQNPDLVPYILDECVSSGLPSSASQLRRIIPTLLKGFTSIRIVVDGLDEIEDREQRQVLSDLISFASSPLDPGSSCKILIASRDIPLISRSLSKRTVLSMGDDPQAFQGSVRPFVHHQLNELRDSLSDIEVDESTMQVIERRLVEKSDGMFLWVRLVMATLEASYTVSDLLDATETLPDGLERAYGSVLKHINSRLHPQQRIIAMQILQWVAFARRPLKSYEIQFGVGLGQRTSTIDDNTKLSEATLELCQPLIERGPRNTIIFAHFTVKEYMLDTASGPFMSALDAEHNVSLALITYLISSITLVDPQIAEEQKLSNVAKGFYSLHFYANEFWVAHFLEYIELNHGLDSSSTNPIFDKILMLGDINDNIMGSNQVGEELPNVAEKLDTHPAMDKLIVHTDIHDFVQGIIQFRNVDREAQLRSSDGVSNMNDKQDPTIFSNLLREYTRLLHKVLTIDHINGLSDVQLAKFRDVYGQAAYTCRIQACIRSSDGFPTKSECEVHELYHFKRFFCDDSSCQYSRMPLMSAAALQKHNHTYHADKHGIDTSIAFRGKQVKDFLNPRMIFKCDYPGCNAAPFQTQYLLNSHHNVHSQSRPHYCPVATCPRGEGGRGFKRKNEMLRHGSVHSSPGYICPFCPDREHKYPRPDALQRHVRVHHVDKDMDDPQLRTVVEKSMYGDEAAPKKRRRIGQ